MPTTVQTERFAQWAAALRDEKVRRRIAARITLLEGGHYGDAKPVGGKVIELRIDHGPGYRLYVTARGQELVILLCGGDKSSQRRDIDIAKEMAAELAKDT